MSVKITKDQFGHKVIRSKSNPEFGYIRVEEIRTNFSGKFAGSQKRSALINGPIELLTQIVANAENDTLPGKVVITESHEPLSSDPQKTLKIAGKTGIVCRVDDQPIYRDTFYTEDMDAKDELIQHTNKDEIQAALEAQKEAASQESEVLS